MMHDFKPGWDTYIERRGYGMEATLTFDEVRTRSTLRCSCWEAGPQSTCETTRR